MLMLSQFKCDRCSTITNDVIQSSSVTCSKCNTKQVLCGNCRKNGCIYEVCNGKLLNAWDRNPGTMY